MGKRRYQRFAKSAQAFQKTEDGKFWKVDGDPSLNFRWPFLSWIRREYEELDTIIKENEVWYTIFIVLGTAGCGKFQYAVQFALKQAHKRPILFKKGENVYIIDGVQGLSEGPFTMDSHEIEDMLDDPDCWLVIDGKQEEQIDCMCRVLVACSTRKSSYEELGKLAKALKLYISPWSEKEVKSFMHDFEPYREEFMSMKVATLDEALQTHAKLGGAARYVIQGRKTADGLEQWRTAIRDVGSDVNLGASILGGLLFVEDVSDRLVHIFSSKDHKSFEREFASDATIDELHASYMRGGVPHAAAILERTVSMSIVGTLWGKLYKSVLVEHLTVDEDSAVDDGLTLKLPCKLFKGEGEGLVLVEPRKAVSFKTLEELRDLLISDEQEEKLLCVGANPCLETIDAAMNWKNRVVLVQIFKPRTGTHGLKVHGLERIDEVLQKTAYEVWSCVPAEHYKATKTQPFLMNTCNKPYGTVVGKISQRVVEVDYRWSSKKHAADIEMKSRKQLEWEEQQKSRKHEVEETVEKKGARASSRKRVPEKQVALDEQQQQKKGARASSHKRPAEKQIAVDEQLQQKKGERHKRARPRKRHEQTDIP